MLATPRHSARAMNSAAIIPAYTHIDWRLLHVLNELQLPILQLHGQSDLVKARSILFSLAVKSSYDSFLLVDSDMVPTPEQVLMLLGSPKLDDDHVVTGAYHTKSQSFAFNPCDHTTPLQLHSSPRFVECWGAGLGFAAITRGSLTRLAEKLPMLDEAGLPWWPFCIPQLVTHQEFTNGKLAYVSEDYSFFWNLRQRAGVTLWLDTHVAVGHLITAPLIPEEGAVVDFSEDAADAT